MELKKLGIYGGEAIQDLVAASILTGDPVLFIGDKGTGKTYMMERIAEALNLKFMMYNCSSANFDDIVGFPIPNKETFTMDFMPTPTSIWGVNMVLLDEINRARLDIQNNYFQLIRNRSVQGKRVDTLRWVFSAMNPLSYAGTTPLDAALADRFAWVIKTPSFTIINEEDRHRIISNHTMDDCPALTHWGGVKHVHIDSEIRKDMSIWFKKAASIYEQYLADCKDVVAYVDDVCISISTSGKSKAGPIEGRRAGIILRNILSLAAVREAYGLSGGIEAAASKALFHSFPNEAVDEAIPNEVIMMAHEKAKHLLRQQVSSILERIERLPDSLLKVAYGIRHCIDPVVLGGYVMQFLDDHKHDPSALIAFAYAVWPYMKHANITSDALTQISKILAMLCNMESNGISSQLDLNSGWWNVQTEYNNVVLAEKKNAEPVHSSFFSNITEQSLRYLCEANSIDFYELSRNGHGWDDRVPSSFHEKTERVFEHMAYIISDGFKFKPSDLIEKQ
jgi:hypothetical protein